jgi:hypothetical protein
MTLHQTHHQPFYKRPLQPKDNEATRFTFQKASLAKQRKKKSPQSHYSI